MSDNRNNTKCECLKNEAKTLTEEALKQVTGGFSDVAFVIDDQSNDKEIHIYKDTITDFENGPKW